VAFSNYKFKVVETNQKIDTGAEFKIMALNKELRIELYRNDTIVKGNWFLGKVYFKDTTSFTLNISNPILDSLKVFDKDSILMAKVLINVFDLPYEFKVVELNKKIQSKTELPILRRNGKYNIQLFKGDSLIKCNWTYGSIKSSDTTMFNVDLYNVNKDSIKVYDKNSMQLAAFIINIYNKPEVKLETKINYNGSFGFDNYYDKIPSLAKDANYKSYSLFGVKNWIPWMSVDKAQTNIRIIIEVFLDAAFLYDSTAYIRINTTDPNIKANFATVTGNDLRCVNFSGNNNKLDIDIVVQNYLDDNQYLFVTDNAGDTLAKVAILCKNLITPKKLIVYTVSDSTTSHSFSFDYTFFNKKSYNQAFIPWDIEYRTFTMPYRNYFANMNVHNNNIASIPGRVSGCLKAMQNVDVFSTAGDVFYLILLPIDSITFTSNNSSGAIAGYYYPNSHCVFLSKNVDGFIQSGIHEIGHALCLYHIFIQTITQNENTTVIDYYNYGIIQGTTNNFLDYCPPQDMTTFWKWQWKLMNNQIP